jgi:class 3 adenylate cyclase
MGPVSVVTRRLAAIVFADVVGWSRLVERNDVETLRSWKTLRAEFLEPKIREHGGQLQEVTGDALFVEFPSAVGAVTWALETQRGLAHREPEGRAQSLSLRISINVEDVIVDE